MGKEKLIPTLVIAGPGAGKTTDMVNAIVSVLPDLLSHRMLATVTYTNSAAETIRKRLAQKTGVPKNVFIGTIHSFLNQFVIIPFATLFEQAGLDKLFLEIDVDEIVEEKIPKTIRRNTPLYFGTKNKIKSQILSGLLRNGKIPLKQISSLALHLMKLSDVQLAVCNRLQFLFIDEFQDVDTVQFEIFDRIRKSNQTHIYAVGDPEQYIMGYTYQGRQKPTFANMPINRFDAERKLKTENHRASAELVSFTNQFHSQIQQTSIKGSNSQSIVLFIPDTSLGDIVSVYQNYCKSLKSEEDVALYFYLSYENGTFEGIAKDYGLVPTQSQHVGVKTALDESLDLICGLVGLTKRQMSEKFQLEPIEVRKMGVMLLEAISKNEVCDRDGAIKFLRDKFKLQITSEYNLEGKDLIRSLSLTLQHGQSKLTNHQYSSIHKAKGLEADAVLVVARNKNELIRWLTTDKAVRAGDSSDTCRIGYVAFTRAKILLCVACLNSLDEETSQILKQTGVSLPSIETQKQSKQMSLL